MAGVGCEACRESLGVRQVTLLMLVPSWLAYHENAATNAVTCGQHIVLLSASSALMLKGAPGRVGSTGG
jgi:hypothetical protein